MSDDRIRPEDEWPLPPVWMWACEECAGLYRTMKYVQEETEEARLTCEPGIDFDPMDSAIGTQIALAQHMASAHPEQLPGWDPACAGCTSHREAVARDSGAADRAASAAHFGNEHRARHVFAPPSIVGLY